MHRRAFLPLLVWGLVAPVASADWMQFRGPGGNAQSDSKQLPAEWGADSNIAWKAKLPGLGTSSPIVVGNEVFVTCYSGYAESADTPGDMSKLMRHLICLDRETGKQKWKKDIEPRLPESEYEGNNATWHGYSSSTPASDGKHLFVFFGKSGAYCFDLAGNQKWRTLVGDGTHRWGSATSPVLYKDLVIINASVESGALIALDKSTGEEKWRTSGIKGAWNTPALVPVESGEQELVVNLPLKIQAYDPATGKELWDCEGIPDEGYVCPSIVSHEGIVYAIGGRKNTAIAVRAGGKGDVTDSHVLWRKSVGANVSSPVLVDGHLYWVHERSGTANCLNAKTGETIYQQRLEPRPGVMYASVTAGDGKLYCPSQHSGTYVLAAKPQFELLAHNVIEGDDSRCNASVAIDRSQVLLRNDQYLYCIGKSTRLAHATR